MFLDNGWSTFDINEKTVFSNGSRSLPRNPLVCIILCNCIFDSFILADELFTKALQIFATCLLVNNNSCRKLVLPLELPIMFDDNFKVNSFAFFVVDFTLLSCEFINFAFTLYWVILYYYYIKPKVLCLSLLVSNYNTLTESKNSSRIKTIVVFPSRYSKSSLLSCFRIYIMLFTYIYYYQLMFFKIKTI